MAEDMDKVQELQDEIEKLKAELASLKADKSAAADKQTDVKPSTSLQVIESIENSSADADLKVETYCRWAAARAGAIVIAPLVGTIALMANEVYLVSRIAKVYNVKMSERAVIAFLGAMGSRMAGNLLTTLIPFSAIQVPVAVGITYSLGRVTQRWLKDGMPTDMSPYIAMMSEWKDKAREQVDKLRDNPLKNVPLGDETVDFMKRWGSTAKETASEAIVDVKEKGQVVVEKGQVVVENILHHSSLVNDVADEKKKADDADHSAEEAPAQEAEDKAEQTEKTAETAAADDAKEAATADNTAEESVEDKVKAAVEAAKTPLE